ncbi:hypothetical protein EV182_000105 [Spiromyces aspiralis]|uniref:Uncharacterized protein n=1 Tax=Spiromyces aspiralis TaxID=68401 RepID=A0ACC1HUY0_9FUNG|nr:hypothetical protein EV182_000105 [Spiromyces aspiralis]
MSLKKTPLDPTAASALYTSEEEKMLAGEYYNPLDPVLVKKRENARRFCEKLAQLYNHVDKDKKAELTKELFGTGGEHVAIEPPIYVDYGTNIHFKGSAFFNFNCVILDVARVDIGRGTIFGPGVQIYTAAHPLEPELRLQELEYANPIKIGDNVWVGGSAIICPGITIGDNSVVATGSVVTKDVPPMVVVAGNPARVIKHLESSVDAAKQ